MYLLCDANAFYCACEQLFRPDLKGKPVIVLTNNDGACAALNKEAKFLGIKRGQPYFEMKNIIKKHNVTAFSSNYALYGNISNRVMTLLESMAPKLTIYSIDEAVMDIQGMESVMPLEVFGRQVQQRVLKEIGLNTGIGVAQTLTLMKLANYAAKKWPATQGVVVLTDRERQRKLMALVPVEDVWGVGRKLSARLNSMGIKTALQLADTNLQLIRKTFGVVLERTCRELNGVDCISIENLSAKEQIIVSRSFGERVTQLQDMRQCKICARLSVSMLSVQLRSCARNTNIVDKLVFLYVAAPTLLNRITGIMLIKLCCWLHKTLAISLPPPCAV